MHTEKHIRAHPVRLVAAATAETEWGTGSCAFMHACICMCMCVCMSVCVSVCVRVCVGEIGTVCARSPMSWARKTMWA
jgi:hypothetical protein